MLFNLLVSKLEDLESIGERALDSLSFSKVVDYFLVSISLFDIIIIEVYNSVSIRKDLPFDSIVEDHLLLAILVNSLDLPVITNHLLNHLRVLRSLAVVLLWELHLIVFFLLIAYIRTVLFTEVLLLAG
jgi:hypothetical protein